MMKRTGVPFVRRAWPWAAPALLAAACAAPPAPGPPTVDQIVERHIAAVGGLEKIRSIQTLRETGRVTSGPHRQARVIRERRRPSSTRFEFTLQGVTSVFVSDGQHGWRMSPFDGDIEPRPLSDEVLADAAEQADIEGPLVDWQAKGHKLELVGRETIDGHETYKLKVTLRSGVVRHEYIDVESHIRVRAESVRQMRGRAVQVEATFGDYRRTDGILFPHLIEVGAAGRPQRMRVVVDSVEVNPTLGDDRFEMAVPAAP
jgi:hypothetical protein